MNKKVLYLINKPAGYTSFDCIRILKKTLDIRSLGHGGTLDKFATGVLPVFTGEGLKLSRFFTGSYPTLAPYWKTYTGVMRLGLQTDTGDVDGTVIKKLPVIDYSVAAISEAMKSFTSSEYWQTPPVYSAKKIGGKRASDLVREGKPVELKPNLVVIRSFDSESPQDEALLKFTVECSKGTYIRSLVLDFAEKIGTCAMLEKLTRTGVGNFTIENCTTFGRETKREELESHALDLSEACSFIPSLEVPHALKEQLHKGQQTKINEFIRLNDCKQGVYVLNFENTPLALFEVKDEIKMLRGFTSDS